MRPILTRIDVGRAAQAACVLEAVSAKPGNVNRRFDFADTTLNDFLLSAVMIGRCMERADRNPVGNTVLSAVRATRSLVTHNTNLGIILLLAPLAKAYTSGDFRTAIRRVLDSLTVVDAVLVNRAIRLAAPGGMGKVAVQDVAHDPNITLLELMTLARERDSIAGEYASGYTITMEVAYPVLERYLEEDDDFPNAIVQAYLSLLAELPDTLIARKRGQEKAKEISRMAAKVLKAGGIASEVGKKEVMQFDAVLRSEGNTLNPGTTADLIAAAIFVHFLQHGLARSRTLKALKPEREESCCSWLA